MHDIEFRGKRTDNGEWVYGYYAHLHKTTYCFKEDCDAHPENELHRMIFEREQDWGLPNYHLQVDVDPKTVGQYTGLKDKNGTKIFEGDILKGFNYPYKHEEEFNYFAEVLWFENSPAFGIYTFKNPKSEVSGISEGNTDYMEDWIPNSWEVIGNIYDNPELLGGNG